MTKLWTPWRDAVYVINDNDTHAHNMFIVFVTRIVYLNPLNTRMRLSPGLHCVVQQ